MNECDAKDEEKFLIPICGGAEEFGMGISENTYALTGKNMQKYAFTGAVIFTKRLTCAKVYSIGNTNW